MWCFERVPLLQNVCRARPSHWLAALLPYILQERHASGSIFRNQRGIIALCQWAAAGLPTRRGEPKGGGLALASLMKGPICQWHVGGGPRSEESAGERGESCWLAGMACLGQKADTRGDEQQHTSPNGREYGMFTWPDSRHISALDHWRAVCVRTSATTIMHAGHLAACGAEPAPNDAFAISRTLLRCLLANDACGPAAELDSECPTDLSGQFATETFLLGRAGAATWRAHGTSCQQATRGERRRSRPSEHCCVWGQAQELSSVVKALGRLYHGRRLCAFPSSDTVSAVYRR